MDPFALDPAGGQAVHLEEVGCALVRLEGCRIVVQLMEKEALRVRGVAAGVELAR